MYQAQHCFHSIIKMEQANWTGCKTEEAYVLLKIIFLISQPKHMLWVLKRNV